MEHVRVGDHNMPRLAHRPPGRAGGVAVVGVGLDIHTHFLNQLIQFADLVGGQRLGGKQIQRPGILIVQNSRKHRQVVAHGFAGGRGGHHHHVMPGEHLADGMGLMAVQLMYTAPFQHGHKPRIQPSGKRGILRPAGRHLLPAHHVFHEHRIPAKRIGQLIYIHPLHRLP